MRNTKLVEKESVVMNKMRKRIISFMVIVFTLAAGVGVFAWFTNDSEATIEEMKFAVGSIGNLKIAKVNEGGSGPDTYGTAVSLSDTTFTLSPVTTKDGTNFFAPVYVNGAVDNVKEITNHTTLTTKYVYEKEFYLKMEDGGSGVSDEYSVFLMGKRGETLKTYFKAKTTDSTSASYAARVSFTMTHYNGGSPVEKTIIYEPNSEGTFSATKADIGPSVSSAYNLYSTVQQQTTGIFEGGNGNDSAQLFSIKAGVDYKVTMRIWLEGCDAQCGNEIASDAILAHFVFGAAAVSNVEETTVATP